MEREELAKRKALYLKILGAHLQRRRKMLGKKQADIEEIAEVNYKHYSKVEKGEVDTKIWYLHEIAKGLETSLSTIIDDVEEEYYSIFKDEKTDEENL